MNLWWRLLWELVSWRTRSKLHWSDVGIRSFRVWPSDLDVFQHMNNAQFFSLMDISRYDLALRSNTWQLWKKLGWYPVVVAETITFRKSLLPWQKFQIESKVVGWDDLAFYFECRFTAGGEIYATAHIRVRFLKRTRGIVTVAEVLAADPSWEAHEPEMPQWVHDWAAKSALPKLKEPAPSIWD